MIVVTFHIVAFVALLVACGEPLEGRLPNSDGASDPRNDGASVSVLPAVVEPGHAVTVEVRNRSGTALTLGLQYLVERKAGSSWAPMELELTATPPALGEEVQSGDAFVQEIDLPALEDGRYRIGKELKIGIQNSHTVYGEFRVERG